VAFRTRLEELVPPWRRLCEALVTWLWCEGRWRTGGGPGARSWHPCGRRFPGEFLRPIRLPAAGERLRRGSPVDLRTSRARVIRALQCDP